jgi:hypothetical protein
VFLTTGQRPDRRLARAYCSPNGPVTVIFRLDVCRYDVISFFTNRSPIVSSTPGGTESGVRPSLEGRCVVAEKFRPADACVVWKAGTRKPGSVTVEAGLEANARCRACRPVLGASIVGGGGLATRDALQSALLHLMLRSSSKKFGWESAGWLRLWVPSNLSQRPRGRFTQHQRLNFHHYHEIPMLETPFWKIPLAMA